jgi:hypothetical protein
MKIRGTVWKIPGMNQVSIMDIKTDEVKSR